MKKTFDEFCPVAYHNTVEKQFAVCEMQLLIYIGYWTLDTIETEAGIIDYVTLCAAIRFVCSNNSPFSGPTMS